MRRLFLLLLTLVAVLVATSAAASAATIGVSIDDPTITETTGSNTTMTFHVALDAPAPSGGLTVDYVTGPGTGLFPAQSTSDYSTTSGTVQFAEGTTTATVDVTIIGDSTDEYDESFKLVLSNAQTPPLSVDSASITKAIGIGTIVDDDPPPTLTVSDAAVPQPVADGVNRVVVFTVSLSAPSGKVVTADYATQDGTGPTGAHACLTQTCTAPGDGDYVPLSGVLTFNPGVSSLQVSVVAIGDSLDVTRTFSMVLTNPSHLHTASVAFTQADVGKTITIAGGPRTIASINPKDVHDALLDAPLTNGAGLAFSMVRNYSDGVVSTGSLASDSAVFVAGDVGKTITVNGVTATIASLVSAHQVNLTGAVPDGLALAFSYSADYNDANVTGGTNQTIADGTGTGTITSVGPGAKITGTSVVEGDAGSTTTAKLTVTLDSPAPQTISLAYVTTDGTAKAPKDYTAAPAGSRVQFLAGESTKTINVTVIGNNDYEGDKTFTVVLSDPQNATLTAPNATGVVTITNDDAVPILSASDVTVAEPKGTTGKVDIPVTLSVPSSVTITADYATADGTAVKGTNYQETKGKLSFAPGVTTQTVSVPIAGDGQVTDDKTFTLTIQNTAPGKPAVVVTVTITDSDLSTADLPHLSVNDASVRVDGKGGAAAVFTVRLDKAIPRHVTVDYATADGTAVAPRDYTATQGTITFGGGQLSQTVTVPVGANPPGRFNASFKLKLANPKGATIGRGEGSGIIINADLSSLPASVTPQRTIASRVLCRSARGCPGLLARWTAPSAGRVKVTVTARIPVIKKRAGKPPLRSARTLVLTTRSSGVRKGKGQARVRVVSARASARMLRTLRAAHVTSVTVTVTFTGTFGDQQRATISVPLAV